MMIKRWWIKRKIKCLESDLYWIDAEIRGLEPSPYTCILAMNSLHRTQEIQKLKNTLSKVQEEE